MSKNINYLLSIPAMLMLASLTACGPSGDDSTTAAGTDTAGSGDTMMSESPEMGSTDSAMSGSMASGTAQISVTNPMPHDMMVSADMGQGPKELGSVKPSETKTFDVDAPAGTTVNLVATDSGKTHSPSGAVTVQAGEPATWTIQ